MMSDEQLWNLLGRRCAPSSGASDKWIAWAKAAILSDDLTANGSLEMTSVDAARYICRLLRVLQETIAVEAFLSGDPAAGEVSGQSLRAAFVRVIALRGGDPMEAPLLYDQGIEEAKLRALVTFDEVSSNFGPVDCVALTATGRVITETASNKGRSKTAAPESQPPAADPSESGKQLAEAEANTEQSGDDGEDRNNPPRDSYYRDHEWLKWQGEEGLGDAACRDRWNGMSDEEREAICPTDFGCIGDGDKEKGRSIVKTAVKKAASEKAKEK